MASDDQFNPWEHPLASQITTWVDKDGNPTKGKYFQWLRGNLRQVWADNPMRKRWKNDQLRPVTPEERKDKVFHPSTKNVGQCYLCDEWMAGSKLECDHEVESDGCYDFETAEKFLWHCAANPPENWALACKPCHKIKSHSQRKGITFEEAVVDKEVIAICKPAGGSKKYLLDNGVEPASNEKLRREQIRKILEGL